MMRFLGVDYGLRRIGLAVSDPDGNIASPWITINFTGPVDQSAQRVLDSVRAEFDIDAFVVGLPLNMDGTEGEQAKACRRFAESIGRLAGKPVHLHDERLSSWSAGNSMLLAGLSRQKRKIRLDRIAAQVILQSFLDGRNPRPTSYNPPDSP